ESQGLEPYRPTGWLAPFERMEEMFDEFFRRPLGRTMWPVLPRMLEEVTPAPMVDIFEEGDTIVVKSELPGMTRADIDVNLTNDTITLSGEKKKEEKIEKKNYYRMERSYGSFRRSFALPAEVQTDKAKASFKDGVLEVRIPKTEAAKKKEHKIKIE
ncbi:MAG: Hsp20/alpha crystallin family protein, partial [Nitrospiraceae bacterium]